MFKYLRTMNSHVSAPEICYLTGSGTSTIYANTVYTVDDSGYLSSSAEPGRTRYIALESKAKGKEMEVKCLRVMPGMVFETFGNSNHEFFKVGLRGTFSEGVGNALEYFIEGGTDLEIVAHHYSETPDDVMVTFI